MYELHRNEQYFFARETLDHLANWVARWSTPACLCAPLLGRTVAEQGRPVAILDIDERFAGVPGFCRYDVKRPSWLGGRFGLIVCDPPFFTVSLSQLFTALRSLSGFDYTQPLLVSYLRRRSAALVGTFAPFGLQPTGYCPTYQTVQKCGKNDIEFFSNLGPAQRAGLL
jgi:hypothetical protein